jgi:hypothetical protein
MNLPTKVRNHWANVLLVSVVSSNMQKSKGGLSWVLTGRDSNGKKVEVDSTSDEIIELYNGRWVQLPNDRGTTDNWYLRVFTSNWSADWLSKQGLSPCAESVQAKMPCLDCKWVSLAHRSRLCAAARKPDPPAPKRPADPKKAEKVEKKHAARIQSTRETAAESKRELAMLPTCTVEAAGSLPT